MLQCLQSLTKLKPSLSAIRVMSSGSYCLQIHNTFPHSSTSLPPHVVTNMLSFLFFCFRFFSCRTPLTLIMGPLEESLEDTLSPLPPAHRARMTIVQRNAKRLLRLVNSILDFSRIEAGRMQVNPNRFFPSLHIISLLFSLHLSAFQAKFEAVDLPAFTEDLASVFRAAFEKAGIDLIVTTTPLERDVYVDVDMWEKV